MLINTLEINLFSVDMKTEYRGEITEEIGEIGLTYSGIISEIEKITDGGDSLKSTIIGYASLSVSARISSLEYSLHFCPPKRVSFGSLNLKLPMPYLITNKVQKILPLGEINSYENGKSVILTNIWGDAGWVPGYNFKEIISRKARESNDLMKNIKKWSKKEDIIPPIQKIFGPLEEKIKEEWLAN